VRRSSFVGLLAVILSIAAAATAPAASATVVIGQSIAGVKLGATKAQVKKVLGKPSKTDPSDFFYPSSVGLRVHFTHGKVDGVLSISKKQRTSKGITIGSSSAAVKAAYPQAKCSTGPYGGSSLYCVVSTHYKGKASYTSFLVKSATSGVTEIELGYGSGII
jgi:hypothetical protein